MDSEQDNDAGLLQGQPYAGAGARLRAARETRNLDLAQIAAQTRIPVRHLEVIEAGDFGALPSRAYAIGFARTFAKAVGLDDAAITEAVRAELAEGQERRSTMAGGMEPGDPAKLPSAGLAWVGALAALVLAIGLIAFFGSRFGAGVGPAPLTAPPSPSPTASTSAAPVAPVPTATQGPVVLTALADVWVRIYEEGGERLIEKELRKDERFTLPIGAADPRINTGRPDLLAITVGGTPVAALSDKPETLSGVPISAAALLARASATAAPAATTAATAAPTTTRAPQRRREATPAPIETSAPAIVPTAPTAAPPPPAAPAQTPSAAPAEREPPAARPAR